MCINKILALTEIDFDFNNNSNKTISKCREYSGNNFKNIIKATLSKTKNSIRIYYFPSYLSNDLKEFIKSVKVEYFKRGVKYSISSVLFISKKFEYVNYETLIYILNQIYKKCNINCSGFHNIKTLPRSKLYRQGINQKNNPTTSRTY